MLFLARDLSRRGGIGALFKSSSKFLQELGVERAPRTCGEPLYRRRDNLHVAGLELAIRVLAVLAVLIALVRDKLHRQYPKIVEVGLVCVGPEAGHNQLGVVDSGVVQPLARRVGRLAERG